MKKAYEQKKKELGKNFSRAAYVAKYGTSKENRGVPTKSKNK